MIIVSCGTEKYPFDRLVKIIDEVVREGIIKEKVIIQSNIFNYKPIYCEFRRILPYKKFVELITQANVYLCHGGVGAIMLGVYLKKIPVVVPRYKKFGENVDDHQVEITSRLAKENIIIPCLENDNIIEKINESLQKKVFEYSNPEKEDLLAYLENELR